MKFNKIIKSIFYIFFLNNVFSKEIINKKNNDFFLNLSYEQFLKTNPNDIKKFIYKIYNRKNSHFNLFLISGLILFFVAYKKFIYFYIKNIYDEIEKNKEKNIINNFSNKCINEYLYGSENALNINVTIEKLISYYYEKNGEELIIKFEDKNKKNHEIKIEFTKDFKEYEKEKKTENEANWDEVFKFIKKNCNINDNSLINNIINTNSLNNNDNLDNKKLLKKYLKNFLELIKTPNGTNWFTTNNSRKNLIKILNQYIDDCNDQSINLIFKILNSIHEYLTSCSDSTLENKIENIKNNFFGIKDILKKNTEKSLLNHPYIKPAINFINQFLYPNKQVANKLENINIFIDGVNITVNNNFDFQDLNNKNNNEQNIKILFEGLSNYVKNKVIDLKVKNKKDYFNIDLHNIFKENIGLSIATTDVIGNYYTDWTIEINKFKESKYKTNNYFHENIVDWFDMRPYFIGKITLFGYLNYKLISLFSHINNNFFKGKKIKLKILKPEDLKNETKYKGELFLIKEIFENLKNNDPFKNIGNGFIFHGKPGNGKTISAKLLAIKLNYSFIYVDSAIIVPTDNCSKYNSADILEEIFKKASSINNCVILFDEFDKLINKSELLAKILELLDKYLNKKNIIFIATTNDIDRIDKALIRAGRLDNIIYLDNPTDIERKNIIDKLLKKYKLKFQKNKKNILINYFVNITQGFSIASIIDLIIKIVEEFESKKIKFINRNVIDKSFIRIILGSRNEKVKLNKKFLKNNSIIMASELFHMIYNKNITPYNIIFATIKSFEKNYLNNINYRGIIYKINKNKYNDYEDLNTLKIEIENEIIKIAAQDIFLKERSELTIKIIENANLLIEKYLYINNFKDFNIINKKEEANNIFNNIYKQMCILLHNDKFKKIIYEISEQLIENDIIFALQIIKIICKNNIKE